MSNVKTYGYSRREMLAYQGGCSRMFLCGECRDSEMERSGSELADIASERGGGECRDSEMERSGSELADIEAF